LPKPTLHRSGVIRLPRASLDLKHPVGLGAPLHAVHRPRGLGPSAGCDGDIESRLSELDSPSATPLHSASAEANSPSPRSRTPSAQPPRAPRMVGLPAPNRIRSQAFSASQRFTRLVAPRPYLMPLTPMGFTSRPQKPIRRPFLGNSKLTLGPGGLTVACARKHSPRLLRLVSPLKRSPPELRTGSHRHNQDRSLRRAPSEEVVLPLMSLHRRPGRTRVLSRTSESRNLEEWSDSEETNSSYEVLVTRQTSR
jgi:hypothetical protein